MCSQLKAQNTDSIPAPEQKAEDVIEKDSSINYFMQRFEIKPLMTDFPFKPYADTLLDDLQRYTPTSRNNYFSLGNIALAHQNSAFQKEDEFGFSYGLRGFDLYHLDSKDLPYFNSRIAFTQLNMILGFQQEQFVNILHTQNINENWNFSAIFNRSRSEGFYTRQSGIATNLGLNTNYVSTNKKYSALGGLVFNQLIAQENGGVNPLAINESFMQLDTKTIPINLSSAQNIRNGFNVFFKQNYNFTEKDSVYNSSDSTYTKEYKIKRGFSHEFYLDNRYFVFEDENLFNNPGELAYHNNIFLDSLLTNDSTRYRLLKNKVSWSDYSSNVKYEAGVLTENIFLYNNSQENTFYNLGGFTNWKINLAKNFFVNAAGKLMFTGLNAGDFKADGDVNFMPDFLNNTMLTSFVSLQNRTPDRVKMTYLSNHFLWDNENNFNNEQIFTLGGKLKPKNEKWDVNFKYQTINNYIYFDQLAMPQQHGSVVNYFSLDASLKLNFKNWTWQPYVITQGTPNDDVLRVPTLYTRQSFYYDTQFFKNALGAQIGVDVSYFTTYFGDAYNPALGMFHLNDTYQVGNFPFIDLFANFKIKSSKVFLSFSNVLADVVGVNYAQIPLYRHPTLAIRFGLQWNFIR